MAAPEALPRNGTLLLVNSFEPESLYEVLTDRGFEYRTTRAASDEWCIKIERV